jgi:transmembrane sensor
MSGRKAPPSPHEDKLHRRGPLIEAAGEWLFEMQEEELSRQQREQLVDSLRESPALVAEMLRARQVDRLLRDFDEWHRIEEADLTASTAEVIPLRTSDVRAPRQRLSQLLRPALGALAAALLVAVGAIYWNVSYGWKTIETDAGERRELVLADGSMVQVGPATRLRVRLEPARRRVVLEQGDALFRVAKDKERPFTVDAARAVVRAVGTAFAVERQADEVVVTVSEGRVAVTRPVTFAAAPPAEEVALSAGQQVAVTPSGQVSSVREVDRERALAWTEGKLVFVQEPVAHVIQQFNRRNRLQLRLNDPSLGQRFVSGVFDAFDPGSFADFLSTAEPVVITRDGDEIAISPAKRVR